MKKHLSLVAVALALTAMVTLAVAEEKEALKSGPQVNEKLAGPFHPLNITGESAGEKHCLYCENGDNPVAMIFAREVTPEVTKLIKKLDGCTVKNSEAKMGGFVVFCSDEEGLDKKLKSMAKEADLKKMVLAIDNPAGPQKYKVNEKADVTVILYREHVVKANYAFAKGQLKDKDIDAIAADVAKITK
jgi:hypothetical protein